MSSKKFSGGGILPIISINKENQNVLCFITFASNKGILSDAGGKIDIDEDIEETCVREFYEESCKLFCIKSESIKDYDFINLHSGITFYRVFLPLFEINLDRQDFLLNRQELFRNKFDKHYLEKSEMIFIPTQNLSQRLDPNSKRLYKVLDVDGNVRFINRRLHKLIKIYQKHKFELKKLNLTESKLNSIKTYYSN